MLKWLMFMGTTARPVRQRLKEQEARSAGASLGVMALSLGFMALGLRFRVFVRLPKPPSCHTLARA